jgi:hypothetical protein
MKVENRKGISETTRFFFTEKEAIFVIATLSDQLFNRLHPCGRAEMISENGEFFDFLIDFDKD